MKKNTKFIIGMTTALAAAGILASCGSKKYKITFVSNSSDIITPIEIDWGQVPVMPETPSKEGYTFAGWFTDQGLKNPYEVSAVETDLTLYGKWTINSYNVKFSTGVEGLVIQPQVLKFGSKITVSNEISRDYYSFGGWYYDQAYTKAYNSNDTVPGHDVTLYAKWIENNFKITFNANNDKATGSMDTFDVKETDATKKLPENKFKVVGMDFLGWSTTPNGEVEYLNGQDLLHVKDNNNFTLYAVWGVKSVTVNFFALNSSGVLEALKDVPEVKYGEAVQAPAASPSLVGYAFNGWGNMQPTTDTVANMSKVYYSALNNSFIKVSVSEGEDISGRNLYEVAKVNLVNETATEESRYFALFNAVKTKIHFIESIDGVAGEEIAVKEGYYQTKVSFTEIDKPAKAGYKVGGWYLDEACHRMVPNTFVSFADTDLTIYLQYLHDAHTLRYSLDGGNSFTEVSRFYDDEIALPEPSKTGYSFLGWATNPDSSVVYDGKMPDDDLDLYAIFVEKTYTITLHGAAAEPFTQTYSYNQTLNLGVQSKTGYDFGGWYYDADFETPFQLTAMPDVDDLELFAKFIAHKHQISFDTDGGTTISTITGVEYGKALSELSIPTPEKTGYAFVKWVDADGNDVNLSTALMGDKDLELTAVYSAQPVKVSIVYKGQDLGASTYSNIDSGETTALADQKGFTIAETDAKEITGYVFEKSDSIDVKADGTSVINVYYTRAIMKVTFVASGIDSEEINVTYGGKITNAPSAFYKNGYKSVFKIGGNGISFADYVVESNITIDVEFVALPQNVTFNANGGSYKGQDAGYVEYTTGAKVALPTADDTVRAGYTLLGWSLTADGDVITGDYEMPANSVTIYAIWQVNEYKISFVSAHGDAPTEIQAAYNSEVTLPAITAEGYTFNGYKNSNDLDVSAGTYIMPLNGDTLTAQWTENSVNLVFHGNGATIGSMAGQTIAYSGSKAIADNGFERTGYHFAGWATSATGAAVYADKANIEASFETTVETIDLYAVWARNSYTVTFDSNGGSNVSPITLEYEEVFDAPKAPTRKGYTFIGWFTEKNGGSIVYPEQIGSSDVTYYAHWQANKYNVIFDSNGGTPVDSLERTQGYTLVAGDFPSTTTSRTGYEFDGWYEFDGTYAADGQPNADWGRKITAENITSFSIDGDDVTFHARWIVKKHTVTYYVNGNPWGDPVSYKYGEAIEKPEDPTLGSGETFLGWSTSDLEALYFDFSSRGFMGDEDIQLYAVISEEKYTINFVLHGNIVYSLDSDSDDTTFLSYIKKLYGETQALEMIYAAINDAVTFQMTDGAAGSISPITAVITYASVGGQPNPGLYFLATKSQTSETLAQYALGSLAGIYGTVNEDACYTDILRSVDALNNFQSMVGEFTAKAEGNPAYVNLLQAIKSALAGDPTGIGMLVADETLEASFKADVLRAAAELQDVQLLLGELQGKAASEPAYAALLGAINEAMDGSLDHITALATYATVATTYSRQELLIMFAVAQGATQEDAARVVTTLEAKYPYAENSQYYEIVAEAGADGIETISNATSQILTVKGEEYSMYEKYAYTPVPLVDGQYFDGWRESVDSVNHTIMNYAEFVERAEPVEEITVAATSTSSVTFTWDEVFGAYGYRVEVFDSTSNELLKTDIVRTNSFKMNGLLKGDSIRVVVTVLKMGDNGEYRSESKGYNATSLASGETLTVSPSTLDSLPVEITYVHTVEDDIGKVSKSGDYYYITENEGQKTYIFFTNTTYGFGSRKLEIVTPGAGVNEVGKSSSNADAIITYNETGSFVFSIDGERTIGIVRAMPDSIKSGANFEKSETATVQPNAKDRSAFESADYLGLDKDSYKIGAAETVAVNGAEYNFDNGVEKYSNGFKFDVNNLSTTGKVIDLDRQYKFFKIDGTNRVEVTDPSKLYFYDATNDVFYFKKGSGAVGDISNLGDYEVEITAKEDDENSYVNTYVPNALKSDAAKMARFKKTIAFTLNEGVNVYSCVGLNKAMADKNCARINIQTNIDAYLAPDMYGYVPYLMDIPYMRESILDWKKDDTAETTKGMKTGDADIVESTVHMTKEDGFGPKIYTYTANGNPAFKDHEGKQVYYAGTTGEYAIESAKFKQNFDNGRFKILAVLPHDNYYTNYASYGLRTAQMFQRVGTGNVDLEINGNYYDISAQDALFCRSASKNSFAGSIATYEIQSCHQMMFVNASNCTLTAKNMNIISNSSNVSSLLGQDSKDVAEIMRFTSGGVSGFMNTNYSGSSEGMLNLSSINVTGSLIGIYCDSGLNASFVHVKDSWANGVYAYCDSSREVSIKNSVVESSGGCAVQVDDQNFTIDKTGVATNPTATIDYSSCTIENFVSGDEQWFKGYSMEVVALGLKSMIDNQVKGFGLTIIQERVNPVSGLESEYMNWEFFTRTDAINKDNYDQTQITNHPEDISTNMNFGSDYINLGINVAQLAASQGMDLPPQFAAFANAQVYGNMNDPSKMIFMLNLTGESYGRNPTLNPVGETQSIIVEVNVTQTGFSIGHMHLFFRQNQTGLGWLQGMVELFML